MAFELGRTDVRNEQRSDQRSMSITDDDVCHIEGLVHADHPINVKENSH